jgi:hypothetical protein
MANAHFKMNLPYTYKAWFCHAKDHQAHQSRILIDFQLLTNVYIFLAIPI